MGGLRPSGWRSIERWSSTLFFLGGVSMLGHAALAGVRAFTDVSTPPDAFVTVGHLLALVGLLGCYPLVADAAPTGPRGTIAVTTMAIGSWVVMTLAQFLVVAGVVASIDAVLPAAFFPLVLASTIATYGVFGVGALRLDGSTRFVGALVLAPGMLLVVLVVVTAMGGGTARNGALVGGGLALSMLSLGYALRTVAPRGATAPLVDETTRG
jgi:hypothetical protein